ncbi:hypothetical protein C8R42DRAFT_680066 [Lentinula raphanica]|nr:hypothetical protein C8R42DRAFT_680066 [Lentinula raphanica]
MNRPWLNQLSTFVIPWFELKWTSDSRWPFHSSMAVGYLGALPFCSLFSKLLMKRLQ